MLEDMKNGHLQPSHYKAYKFLHKMKKAHDNGDKEKLSKMFTNDNLMDVVLLKKHHKTSNTGSKDHRVLYIDIPGFCITLVPEFLLDGPNITAYDVECGIARVENKGYRMYEYKELVHFYFKPTIRLIAYLLHALFKDYFTSPKLVFYSH